MTNTKKDNSSDIDTASLLDDSLHRTLAPYLIEAADDDSDSADYLNRLLQTSGYPQAADPLPDEVSAYIQAALAASSRKKYQSDLKRFIAWGGVIPASPALIASYLAAHGQTHAPATLQRWLVAIGKAHTTQSLPNPCKSELVHLTYRGIRRTRIKQPTNEQSEKPALTQPLRISPLQTSTTDLSSNNTKRRKRGPTGAFRGQVKALELDDLKKMILSLENSAKDCRDRALLLLGFMGARRRSELIAMTIGDFELRDEGLIVQIPYSKTDQEGKGEEIEIAYAADPRFCPIRALDLWINDYLAPLYPDGIPPDAPIFRSVNRYGKISDTRLSDRSVARIIKARCQSIGLPIDDFSGHSLRAGFATAAAKLDKPSWQIRKQTLHKSDTMLNRYIRDGQRFKNNPGDGML